MVMEIVESIESVVTILAILLGGAYAVFKLGVFRDLKPHLTITQSVSHRSVGSKYVHISVTVLLQNSSKVAVTPRNGRFRIQTLSSLTDEEIEVLYEETFVKGERERIWWPTLEELGRSWGEGELIIEPGGSHYETYEFLIGAEHVSVLLYAYIENPNHVRGSDEAQGWSVSTVYDRGKLSWGSQ